MEGSDSGEDPTGLRSVSSLVPAFDNGCLHVGQILNDGSRAASAVVRSIVTAADMMLRG